MAERSNFGFEGRNVMVTGAAGTLGRATARAFHDAGARLALLDLDEAGLREVAGGLDGARPYVLDITDAGVVKEAMERILNDMGRVDILANIAGGFAMGPLLQDTDDATWQRMFDLNLRSVFNTCRAVVPHMLEAGFGRIINVSARAAREGKGKMGPYCASKAGVITLTESLARENWDSPVNVNCILPGTIDTPPNRESMPDADFAAWVTPSALADVILFLAAEESRAINGAAIPVYGRS
ncbi:MAG: SDR family NAD(P)-dependent oxidoreductase [Gammaproteobacteria bacterium]|nr:SDR family NAD(P)-dependent oxidoreductase [Gammaproteobacteria bacterium]